MRPPGTRARCVGALLASQLPRLQGWPGRRRKDLASEVLRTLDDKARSGRPSVIIPRSGGVAGEDDRQQAGRAWCRGEQLNLRAVGGTRSPGRGGGHPDATVFHVLCRINLNLGGQRAGCLAGTRRRHFSRRCAGSGTSAGTRSKTRRRGHHAVRMDEKTVLRALRRIREGVIAHGFIYTPIRGRLPERSLAPHSVHAHSGALLLDEPDRDFLRPGRAPADPQRRPCLNLGAQEKHPALHRAAQRYGQNLQVDLYRKDSFERVACGQAPGASLIKWGTESGASPTRVFCPCHVFTDRVYCKVSQ